MARWTTCAECEGKCEVLCLRCLGIGEDPDEDGVACVDCLGEGTSVCEPCDGVGGWFTE